MFAPKATENSHGTTHAWNNSDSLQLVVSEPWVLAGSEPFHHGCICKTLHSVYVSPPPTHACRYNPQFTELVYYSTMQWTCLQWFIIDFIKNLKRVPKLSAERNGNVQRDIIVNFLRNQTHCKCAPSIHTAALWTTTMRQFRYSHCNPVNEKHIPIQRIRLCSRYP